MADRAPYLGCHVSVSRGYEEAVKAADRLGARSLQFFSKNPRALLGKPADPADGARGARLAREMGMVAVAHAPYLLNLSTPDEDLREPTLRSFLLDLQSAGVRGAIGLVVHCGKHVGRGEEEGMRRMREMLARALEEDTSGVPVLLENTAHQGTEVGYTVEQLLALADGFPPDRVGFCFDTCHAMAAGILDPEDPLTGWTVPEFLSRVRCVHLNDSRFPFGARRDRHELIGRGMLGREAIRALLAYEPFQPLPMVLETPVAKEEDYADEIAACREILRGGAGE